MIRPSPEVVHALGATVRQYPILLEWMQGWQQHELSQLPYVTTNAALAQGRCQVLKELYEFAEKSPEHAAESK